MMMNKRTGRKENIKLLDYNVYEALKKNKYFKIIKVGGIAVGGIYLFGHLFHILAFTNLEFQRLKNSFKLK